MPPRLRPTARLLTPAGWASLLAVALVIGAAAWAMMVILPGA
ncbi:MAG: hypothetical protein PSX79_09450 [bacterium]|nr:hypothetical protein [bacterium]